MTNSFIVAVWVMLSTNQVDTLLTPVGDDILRSMVTVQTHVYTIPGFPSVTNAVPVATNSTRLQMRWVEIPVSDLPPVPNLFRGALTNNAYTLEATNGWLRGEPQLSPFHSFPQRR